MMKFITIVATILWAGTAIAQDTLVALQNGINHIDLDGDGVEEQIIKTWRENYNAHGYNGYLFLGMSDVDKTMVTITLSPPKASHQDMVFSGEGVDCTYQDYFLVSNEHGIRLVKASRSIVESFAAHEPVTFEFYQLAKNDEGIPGDPYRFWQFNRTVITEQKYCDVSDALKTEILNK